MKYNIILQEGWMGDTLWACNVIKNLSDMGYDIVVFHKWKFMESFIDLFEINQNPQDLNLSDYKTRIYTHRLDHFQNPLLDYIKSFNIEKVDLEKASKFYSVENQLREKYSVPKINDLYITYDNDWQNRTKLNIEYIINKLKQHINVIPIGGDRFAPNPSFLIESAKTLVNSKFHLGMVGGTTHLATYLDVHVIGSSDHLYNHYNKGETPEEFLDKFKPFPNHWANSKHTILSPLITEDEFIKETLNLIKNKMEDSKTQLEQNYITVCNKQNDLTPYCPLLDHMAAHVSSVIEMGIGPLNLGLNSTWGLLHGLNRSEAKGPKKYTAIDYPQHIPNNPLNTHIFYAQKLAKDLGIDFSFIEANSIEVNIEETDLLFIDTDHRYQHLMQELIMHSPKVKKYIVIHDTSGFYGHKEDLPFNHEKRGELKNSPEKYGLWPCVIDFLKDNNEWKLLQRYEDNSGMTIIERI